ncbi:hypothetical protein [Aromatoleum tolulyticum]|uniref:hypothetical protein n=1 Tax=Aromatoleum tolulyticum TaxID=34027 RepID=UPI000970F6FC|nr:hypothetical protein [Aromatoleum tolulyticum]
MRILTSGPAGPEDWSSAAKLIESGYADGKYARDKARDTYGEVKKLIEFSVNIRGQLFADELAEQLHRTSWRYRLMQACLALLGYGMGFASGLGVELAKQAVGG